MGSQLQQSPEPVPVLKRRRLPRRQLLWLLSAVVVIVLFLAAWELWPCPIEGFWDAGSAMPCLCDGCKFLYFKDGRVYHFCEGHTAGDYLGRYRRVSPGVCELSLFNVSDSLVWNGTMRVHRHFLRWTAPNAEPETIWRLFRTAEAEQILKTKSLRNEGDATVLLDQ
jgi:hypothetical protein